MSCLVWRRRLRGELIALHNFLRRGSGDGDATPCSLITDDRKCKNSTKLGQGRFRLDVSKKLFAMRVVKHWHRPPREAVDVPRLSVFNRHLDNILIGWKGSTFYFKIY